MFNLYGSLDDIEHECRQDWLAVSTGVSVCRAYSLVMGVLVIRVRFGLLRNRMQWLAVLYCWLVAGARFGLLS